MSVINTLKSLLSDCQLLDQFNGIHVDYTEKNEAGLYTTGANLVKEDILGNALYRMNCQLYTGMRSAIDFDRLQNSEWLLELTYYLNGLKDIPIVERVNGIEKNGYIKSVKASNAMAYSVPSGDLNDGMVYQLQIAVEYVIEN